jgi:hypothetical protein
LIPGPRFYREGKSGRGSDLINLCPPLYLCGYFQSERYFSRIEQVLRTELRPRDPATLELASSIARRARASGPLIGIHVRRGDYLHSKIRDIHVSPSEDYLTRAMAQFGSSTRFLIVSDDASWCRKKLDRSNVVIADPADLMTDLFTFAACDGYILSASSFSWWGAWLGDSDRRKQVIAPQSWYGGRKMGATGEEIYPEHWRRL